MTETASTRSEASEESAVASAISRGIVGLYAKHYGRGPKRARTHVANGYVLTVLEEGFTQAEHTLLESDHRRQVEETRRALQEAICQEFIEVVEEATGRTVDQLLSQIHVPSEVAVEVFLLAPGGTDGTAEDACP